MLPLSSSERAALSACFKVLSSRMPCAPPGDARLRALYSAVLGERAVRFPALVSRGARAREPRLSSPILLAFLIFAVEDPGLGRCKPTPHCTEVEPRALPWR